MPVPLLLTSGPRGPALFPAIYPSSQQPDFTSLVPGFGGGGLLNTEIPLCGAKLPTLRNTLGREGVSVQNPDRNAVCDPGSARTSYEEVLVLLLLLRVGASRTALALPWLSLLSLPIAVPLPGSMSAAEQFQRPGAGRELRARLGGAGRGGAGPGHDAHSPCRRPHAPRPRRSHWPLAPPLLLTRTGSCHGSREARPGEGGAWPAPRGCRPASPPRPGTVGTHG